MAISLDGITLNVNMVWAERYTSQRVAQSVRRTLGGTPVVFVGAIPKGLPITLQTVEVGGGLMGVLRRSVVTQLLERADVPGAVYILIFNGISYSVIFRSDDPPAVDMQPVLPRTADGADDYMRGSIKLLTV
jgi:hypothetical protein